MGVIFVSGVHGVGKTTTCEQAAAEVDWIHRSASSIIREEKASAIQNKSKSVKDIPGNQELLVKGLRKITIKTKANLLLDGHFTIQSDHSEIVKIDRSVFEALALDAVVLIHDTPENIAKRINDRDSVSTNFERIARHQNLEEEHAKEITEALAIPLLKIAAFDSESLREHLLQFQQTKETDC